jgi:hypothetical protein
MAMMGEEQSWLTRWVIVYFMHECKCYTSDLAFRAWEISYGVEHLLGLHTVPVFASCEEKHSIILCSLQKAKCEMYYCVPILTGTQLEK